jgi:hypothetical protein
MTAFFWYNLNFRIMRIKFGAIITDGRGKIGGMFVKRMPNGHSLNVLPRTKSKEVLSTHPQLNLLGYIFRSWSTLSEGDRNLYIDIAASTPVTDAFGNLKYLNGRQMFTALNGRVFQQLNTFIDVANYTNVIAVGVWSLGTVDIANAYLDMIFTHTAGTSNAYFRFSRLSNASISGRFINSKVDYIQAIDSTDTFDMFVPFINTFPQAMAGQTYQVSIVSMNDYGVVGSPQVLKWTF